MQPKSTSATTPSNWSPTEWPRLSLTVLKLSRSKNMTAMGLRVRSMRATARFSRSVKSALLARPVSESWKA